MPPRVAHQAKAHDGRRALLQPGDWDPAADRGPGFVVVEGLISRDVMIGSGVARDLLGPGDLATLALDPDELVPVDVRWTVCAPSQVTFLDQEVLAGLASRPDLGTELLNQAARQASRQAVHRAIAQIARTDQRVVAFLWMLAERWGRVSAHGVVVPVVLTHEALGHMVGAKRPTVSLALKHLGAAGVVTRRADGSWLLSPGSNLKLATRDHRLVASAPAPAASLAHIPDTGDSVRSASPPHDWDRVGLERRIADAVLQHARSRERMFSAVAAAQTSRAHARTARDERSPAPEADPPASTAPGTPV